MNKDGLVKWIRNNSLLSKKECKQAVDILFEKILDEISKGNEVSIKNFGTFMPYNHSPRPVRNLVTGEEMILTKHRTMKFKISNVAKVYIKENSE